MATAKQNAIAEATANTMSDFVNSFNVDEQADLFCDAMTRQHRTLQQSFTKLAMKWIEKIAADDYLTDGRNEKSKEIANRLLENFDGDGFKPSEHLPMI